LVQRKAINGSGQSSQAEDRVSVGGVSSLLAYLNGIPQGSVLGPLLFINDTPEVVNSLIRMFADDTKLFRIVNRDADSTVLQTDLIAIQEWSNK